MRPFEIAKSVNDGRKSVLPEIVSDTLRCWQGYKNRIKKGHCGQSIRHIDSCWTTD